MANTLLLPFKYRTPFHTDIVRNPEYYVRGFGHVSEKNQRELLYIQKGLDEHSLEESAWRTFSENYLLYLAENNDHHVTRDGWKMFHSARENPSKTFNDLLLSAGESYYFANIPSDFIILVDEVLRDRVITDAEREFLDEKCAEFHVSRKDLDWILNTKRSLNTSLLVLIDQICSDHRITTAEFNLLSERAKQWNISQDELLNMTERSFHLHTRSEDLDKDPIFSNLVASFFVSQYILHDQPLSDLIFHSINQYFKSLKDQGTLELDYVQDKLRDALNKATLYEAFPTKMGLADMMLAIENIDHRKITDAEEPLPTSKPTNPGILLNGLRYTFAETKNRYSPLFSHEMHGNTVIITMNHDHPFLESATPDQVFTAQEFALSITATQMQLYADSEAVEDFFDQMRVNDKVVARKLKSYRAS
jgi:hypothetical protein